MYKTGFSEKVFSLPASSTTRDLLSHIEFNKPCSTIMTRNGRAVSLSDNLNDGDRVAISPLYSGG